MATILFRAVKDRPCDLRQAPPRFAGSAKVTVFSFAPRAAQLACQAKVQSLPCKEKTSRDGNEVYMSGSRSSSRRFRATGMALIFAAVLVVAPVVTAGQRGDEHRLVSYRTVNKAEIENLQRWVAAGHADWCKDARLVAAEELTRIAADFGGDAAALSAGPSGDAKQMTFEWATLDGQVLYRVTVERFEWLMPIAKDADGMVWVPTVVEVQLHRSAEHSGEKPSSSGTNPPSLRTV